MFKVSVFFTDTVMLLLLDDCSVNDRLIKVAQFMNQSFFQMVNVTNLVMIHSLLQNAPDRVVNW